MSDKKEIVKPSESVVDDKAELFEVGQKFSYIEHSFPNLKFCSGEITEIDQESGKVTLIVYESK